MDGLSQKNGDISHNSVKTSSFVTCNLCGCGEYIRDSMPFDLRLTVLGAIGYVEGFSFAYKTAYQYPCRWSLNGLLS
jgi:hypothetical protein